MFNYQSQSISFGDWMLLLTLCFAPLIAHLVAGVPPTGELTQNLILCLSSNPLSQPLPLPATLDRPRLSLQPNLNPLALLCYL